MDHKETPGMRVSRRQCGEERTRSTDGLAAQLDPELPSESLSKIGAKDVSHARYFAFQIAEMPFLETYPPTSCG
jgi:hypothetical protein